MAARLLEDRRQAFNGAARDRARNQVVLNTNNHSALEPSMGPRAIARGICLTVTLSITGAQSFECEHPRFSDHPNYGLISSSDHLYCGASELRCASGGG